MSPEPADPSLPARLREFHERLPLAGDPPNAVLSLQDDRILYLVALLRDTPQPAPTLSLDEWRAFRDALVPHGIPAPRVPPPLVAGGLPAAGGRHGLPGPGLPLRGRCGPAHSANSIIVLKVVHS